MQAFLLEVTGHPGKWRNVSPAPVNFLCGKITALHPSDDPALVPTFTSKNQLMISRTFLSRLIILGFMVLVGYALAKSIQAGSIIGAILSLTSLGAGIYLLYLVAKAKQEMETEETA